MSTTLETPPSTTPTTEDRTIAILAYITIIGFIIAIVMHSSKKTAIGSYHLRQALGLIITAVGGGLALAFIPVIGWIILPFFYLTVFIFVIMGLISAVNGQQKPLPVLGEKYQQWFAGAFV